jgi:hypothetical protein
MLTFAVADVVNNVDALIVSVCNKGTVVSSELTRGVSVTVDGNPSEVHSLNSLSPGDCTKESFRLPSISSFVQTYVKIVVDPGMVSKDSYLDNNYRIVPIIRKGEISDALPDLVVSDIQIFPERPTPTDQLIVTFTVKNVGNGPARVAWVDPSSRFYYLASTIVYLNDKGLDVLPWDSQDLGGFIGAPRILNHEFDYIVGDDGTLKFTDPNAQLFLRPRDEVRLSTAYFRGTNQPSLIRPGKNVIRVFADRLYPQQPESGIVVESDEQNNFADFEFTALSDPGFDTEAFGFPCSRVNGDYFISNEFRSMAGNLADYDVVLRYVLVTDKNFLGAWLEPYPTFDPSQLYPALYNGYDSVLDSSGKKYPLVSVKPTGLLPYGSYYWSNLPDNGILFGVVTATNLLTKVGDHNVVTFNFDTPEKEWNCRDILKFEVSQDTAPVVVTNVPDDTSTPAIPSAVEEDNVDSSDTPVSVVRSSETPPLESTISSSSDSFIGKFLDWIKRVF